MLVLKTTSPSISPGAEGPPGKDRPVFEAGFAVSIADPGPVGPAPDFQGALKVARNRFYTIKCSCVESRAPEVQGRLILWEGEAGEVQSWACMGSGLIPVPFRRSGKPRRGGST